MNIAIKNLVIYAKEKVGRRKDAIDHLILIATDKELKTFHKSAEMNEAGLAAIQISLTHRNYYDCLISIANNIQLNHIINVKAAIALTQIIMSEAEKGVELPDVVKKINTRWLKIAFETVRQKLSIDELKQFYDFLEFVEENRNVA